MTQDKCNFPPENKTQSWNEVFKILIIFLKKLMKYVHAFMRAWINVCLHIYFEMSSLLIMLTWSKWFVPIRNSSVYALCR